MFTNYTGFSPVQQQPMGNNKVRPINFYGPPQNQLPPQQMPPQMETQPIPNRNPMPMPPVQVPPVQAPPFQTAPQGSIQMFNPMQQLPSFDESGINPMIDQMKQQRWMQMQRMGIPY